MALQREGFLFGWLSQLAQGERGWGGRQQGCVRLVAAWEAVGRRLVGGGCRHAHREEGYIRRGAQTGEMKPFCMLGIETACCKRTWRTAGAPCRQGGGWRVLVSAVCAQSSPGLLRPVQTGLLASKTGIGFLPSGVSSKRTVQRNPFFLLLFTPCKEFSINKRNCFIIN